MPVTRWMGIVMALAGAVVPSQGVVAQSAKADSGWMKDFDTAQSESQRLNRPLLIHFHADWCVPCRRMDRDVLSSPELAEQFQQAFVGVKVDADQHPELLKRFGVRSLPADVVVSPDGKQ
jgi:thiol:disulfide interchange protein